MATKGTNGPAPRDNGGGRQIHIPTPPSGTPLSTPGKSLPGGNTRVDPIHSKPATPPPPPKKP